MSLISAYSMVTRRPVVVEVAARGVERLVDLPAELTGTSSSRSSSSGACSESANVTGMSSSASLSIAGTSPTVDTVMPRADMPSPSGAGSVSRGWRR